jgi:hypothetical protein
MGNARSFFFTAQCHFATPPTGNAILLTIYNPGGSRRSLYLRRLRFSAICDAAASTPSTMLYVAQRFHAPSAPTGGRTGAMVPANPMDKGTTGQTPVAVAQVNYGTTIVLSGATYDAPFATAGIPRVPGCFSDDIGELGYPDDPFVVASGDGIAVSNSGDLVGGDGFLVNGMITEVGPPS